MRIALSVVLVLALAGNAAAVPTDFNFKDVELRNVFSTIGTLGKVNVVLDDTVGRMKTDLALRNVEPLDALFLVAKSHELKVKRVKWEEGSTTTTYFVGRREVVEKGFEYANSRTIQLKYANAEQVAAVLTRTMGKDHDITVDADPRTNRLMVRAVEEVLERMSLMVLDLDLPVPAVKLELTLLAGPGEKRQPVWHGSLLTLQGGAGHLEMNSPPAAKPSGWALMHMSATATSRTNSDNFCALSFTGEAKLDRAGAPTAAKFAAEVQAKDGEETTIGTVEVAPGEIVELRVRPVVEKRTVAPLPPAPQVPSPAASPSPSRSVPDNLEGL